MGMEFNFKFMGDNVGYIMGEKGPRLLEAQLDKKRKNKRILPTPLPLLKQPTACVAIRKDRILFL